MAHLIWFDTYLWFDIFLLFYEDVLHQNAPQYICEIVSFYHPNRQLRSGNTTPLHGLSSAQTITYGRRLMDTGVAILWNNLPNNIKCASFLQLSKKNF